jgi:acyl-CoA-binding protein
MDAEDLENRFQEAVNIADNMSQATLPQDVQLRLYAYYKQATFGTVNPSSISATYHLRDAFKTNAWMQISHLTADEAKELYIEAIEALTKK